MHVLLSFSGLQLNLHLLVILGAASFAGDEDDRVAAHEGEARGRQEGAPGDHDLALEVGQELALPVEPVQVEVGQVEGQVDDLYEGQPSSYYLFIQIFLPLKNMESFHWPTCFWDS